MNTWDDSHQYDKVVAEKVKAAAIQTLIYKKVSET